MKNLLTIFFLAFASILFAQPVSSTITSDGSVVTIATPVNSKLVPVCNFNWVIVDGNLRMWVTGSNEIIPGGRLKYFTVSGVTDNSLKDEALGAISAQCAGGVGSIQTTDLSDFDEAVEDKIGSKIVAGANVTVTYNDVTGNTTIAASGSGGGTVGKRRYKSYGGQSNFIGPDANVRIPNPPIFISTSPRVKVAMPNGTLQTVDPTLSNLVPGSYVPGVNIISIPIPYSMEWVKKYPVDTLIWVGFAGGGLPIERWTPATSGSVGETSDNFCLDSLINKLNRLPADAIVDEHVWHQGESGSGNATYLTKLFSLYDTLARHPKVDDNFLMIIGDYAEVLTSAPHIPLDSILFGTKDLGGRNIVVANYICDRVDYLYDGTIHFDPNFMMTVGRGYFAASESARSAHRAQVPTLEDVYNASGTTPVVSVDGNGGSNGLRWNYTGANGLIHDLSTTTGTARYKGVRSGSERSSWFRPDGRAVFNSSVSNPETPMATSTSAAVLIDMGVANESGLLLSGNNNARIYLENHASSNDAGIWSIISGGSATSPSFSLNNARGFYLSARSWGGGSNTTYVEGAKIEARANGDWGFSNRSFNWWFSTATGGTSTMVDRFFVGDLVKTLSGLSIDASLYQTNDITITGTSYSPTLNDLLVKLDATANNINVTLPAASDGRIMEFSRVDNTANTITLTGNVAGVTNPTSANGAINGLATQRGYLRIRGNGTSWEVINNINNTIPVTLVGGATLDFGSVSAQDCSDLTITVTGATNGDEVVLGVTGAALPTKGLYSAYVSANDTVTVRFCNPTSTPIDPSSGSFAVSVFK